LAFFVSFRGQFQKTSCQFNAADVGRAYYVKESGFNGKQTGM